jgi:hypothetical protein
MNQKDKKEIGLNMAILMDSILDQNSDSSEVTNRAITFCSEMFKKYPELKEYTEFMVEDDWDKNIAWINWERNFL